MKKQFLLITIILFGLAWFSISPLVFFSNDIGLRYLQMRQLIEHHWQTFAVDYPARVYDPTLQHSPFYYAYSLIDNEFYLQITPFFPLIGSFLLATLGKVGLVLLPVVSTLGSVWGMYQLAKLAKLSHLSLFMWATVFATPLIIYTLELWDHGWGMMWAVWGVLGVSAGMMRENNKWILLGGISLGFALGQRPELYIFAIAVGLSFLFVSRFNKHQIGALILGGLIGAIPVWILQYIWVGHPLGMAFAPHLFGYGVPDTYPIEAYAELDGEITRDILIGWFLFFIKIIYPLSLVGTLLTIIGVFLTIFAWRVPRLQTVRFLTLAIGMTALGYLFFVWTATEIFITGLMPTIPFIAFAFVYLEAVPERQTTRSLYLFVLLTTLIFISLMLLLWPSYGGNQWGARYLMPAYPLLLFLAFYVYEALLDKLPALQRICHWGFITLLLISTLLHGVGARKIYQTHALEIETRDNLAALPANLIITSNPFAPSAYTSLEDKVFMYVNNGDDLEQMLLRLAEDGIRQVAIIDIPHSPLKVPTQINGYDIHQVETVLYEIQQP